MGMERHGRVMLRGGKRITLRKTFPSTALLTTNPIWTDPVANPDLCGEIPELNVFLSQSDHRALLQSRKPT
jgi:hypothetical protein